MQMEGEFVKSLAKRSYVTSLVSAQCLCTRHCGMPQVEITLSERLDFFWTRIHQNFVTSLLMTCCKSAAITSSALF